MKLVFQGGEELIEVHIDREKKELKVSSSKTNYQPVNANYSELFKASKYSPSSISEETANRLSNEDFKRLIVTSFGQQGYKLKE